MKDIKDLLQERKSVLWALVNKEIAVKLGDSYFSYAWIILEPLLYIGLFCFIFFYINKHTLSGMDILTFISTGVLPFLYFRRTVQYSSSVINASKKLLNYSRVGIFDAIVARFLLETVIAICVTFMLVFVISIFSNTDVFYPIRILYSILMLVLLTFSVSIMIAVVCYYLPDFSKILGVIFRILIFTSGVFFSLSQIPDTLAYYLSYNPLFQIIENIRSSLTFTYVSSYLSLSYMTLFISICLFLGVGIYFISRENIAMGARGR